MKLRVKVGLAGQAGVAEAFHGVRAAVRNKVLKDACRKQAGKAAKVAKAYLTRKRTGQLARSVAYLYRTYKRGTAWLYVVGPRKGFRVRVSALTAAGQRTALNRLGRQKGRRKKLSDREAARFLDSYVDPAKYAHLVEGGRKAVRPAKKRVMSGRGVVYGRHAAAVQPRPFMEPAAAAAAGGRAEMTADVLDGIDREARKYAARGKGIRG